MAKKAYIGVDGVAKKIKSGYVGVHTNFGPVSSGNNLSTANISDGSGAGFTAHADSASDNNVSYRVLAPSHTFPTWCYHSDYTSVDFSTGSLTMKVTKGFDIVVPNSLGPRYINGGGLYSQLWGSSSYGSSTLPNSKYSANCGLANGKYIFSIVLSDGSVYSVPFTYSGKDVRTDAEATFSWGSLGVKTFATQCAYDYDWSKWYDTYLACWLYIIPNNNVPIEISHIELIKGTEHTITFPSGDVARKIKKAYIGIGGVARPCWSGGDTLAYYGTVTQLSEGRKMYSGKATLGNYVLMAGGISCLASGAATTATTDVYDTSLTRTSPTNLSVSYN